MNPSFYIAKRYLFSKKSHNAINIISLVAVCGVAIATMATVCTLSVFNGFRDFGTSMFSSFDPELKITPVSGKVFNPTGERFAAVRKLPELSVISESLDENVLVIYGNRQTPAVMKGVSDNFGQLVPIQNALFNGTLTFRNETSFLTIPGVGVASALGVNANFIYPLEICAPKRNARVNMSNPLSNVNREYAYISDLFMINEQVYDDNYMLVPLALARALLEYETEVSALEIKLKDGVNIREVQQKIQQLVGADYVVKDRFEQQAEAFNMISIEKWISFLMLCFILCIATFNSIGSLSMLIVEKQKDILTLRNLGADNRLISRIFLFEGWMISVWGAVSGLILGVLLCLGQQYFGWIQLGNSGMFAINAYPVQVQIGDLLLVLAVVLSIGFLAVVYPVRYLARNI
ncbi:MAG: Lipoprotein-releasing system transmembrane protein LolE [Candidatus Ordinivivax streblomastigis]|uniref:Lipoprotein-releasing system transmembrane protein LolE n=1 Tax=Candidatus Ordinivivax streblomastigis TaxID=2540710 RepID=A0A5M8NZ53_9BACT|nr:MAG: Lipoprotein-releasing system transmembrane protein LolE [Candidatus Ordinivivax streblomastigis]